MSVGACLLLADVKPVGPATNVTEAKGAKYTGIVFLLVTLVPFGVLIGLDVMKMAKPCKKRKKPRRLRQPSSKVSEVVL